jgi:hypothetical protein
MENMKINSVHLMARGFLTAKSRTQASPLHASTCRNAQRIWFRCVVFLTYLLPLFRPENHIQLVLLNLTTVSFSGFGSAEA